MDAMRSEGVANVTVLADEAIYLALLEGVEEAEAQAITYAVGRVRQLMASRDDGVALRAATTFLERKDPGGWSRAERTQTTIMGDPEHPVSVTVSADDQIKRTEAILAELVTVGALTEPDDEDEEAAE